MNLASLSPALRAHVAVAIRAHIRQLQRDGLAAPDGLAALAAVLWPDDRNLGDERGRVLARERMRRWRARRRGEDVPLRKPGPCRRSA
jgi:hypothetical protein